MPSRRKRGLRRERLERIGVPGLALVALLLTGCGDDEGGGETTKASAQANTAPTPTATQQETVPAVVKVSIGDNLYKPKDLDIRRGQSISWRNQGAVAHTVTSDGDSDVKFDSGNLDPGGVYALKPTTPGQITYHCTIHGKGMSGTVTVAR
jgi:plastocyanin